jgi:hypothetical protein
MSQRVFGTLSRQDTVFPPGSQADGATALFLYSGEVSFNITEDNGNAVHDTIQILLETSITRRDQIAGLDGQMSNPIPIVVPTSIVSFRDGSIIAINRPSIQVFQGTDNPPSGGAGLYIFADVTVQNGSLANAQYQLSLRVKNL